MISQVSEKSELALSSLLSGKRIGAPNLNIFFADLFSHRIPCSFSRSAVTLLAERGENPDELLSAWKAIRHIELKKNLALPGALDTCGTGGDGSHSLNLSTLSSVVMAAAGVRVLKHGNRAITSVCGSSDLLEAFGMNLNQTPSDVIRSAKLFGMGYFHAQSVHPVYASFQNLRKSIRIRTLFNLLGPVLNPVSVDYQILGIARPELESVYSDLLPKMGRKSALIISGACGMDEITSLGKSTGIHLSGKIKKRWSLNPAQLGFKIGHKKDLQIRSISHAKQMTIDILHRKIGGTAADSVVLSAACGIWLVDKQSTLKNAVTLAQSAITNGKAWHLLNQMTKYSKHDS